MDPERAEAFAEDLLDKEKLKDITAADGTLPGGVCVCVHCNQFAVTCTYLSFSFWSV